MNTRHKPKKKRNSFLRGLIALVIALVVIIALVLIILYKGLESFEYTTPRAAMDAYFTQISQGDFDTIKEESGFEPTEFNTWEDYIAFLHKQFGEKPSGYIYRQIGGGADSGGDAQLYAVYDGDERIGELELTESAAADHGYTVRAAIEFQEEFTVTAPGHVTVMANGEALDKVAAEQTPLEIFSELPAEEIPVRYTYKISESLTLPEVTATGPEGQPCEVKENKEKGRASVKQLPGEEELPALVTRMEETVKTYATFISEDTPFSAFAANMYPGTPYYESMSTYYVGWYADHSSYEFLDMQTSNIQYTSETSFVGDVEYTFRVMFQGAPKDYPSKYRMGFALYNGEWKLVKMEMLE